MILDLTPILTPNFYGYRVCGNMPDHPCTYRNNIAAAEPVTSSAFADDMGVPLGDAQIILN